MIHLRVVAPPRCAHRALELLERAPSVVNLIHLEGASRKPDGDVILCDVAREDASVIVGDLRDLGIERDGSIALEAIDTAVADAFDRAEEAAPGLPSDAVVWEEVEARTSEQAELSVSFLAFMAIAMVIAAVGILTDNPVLIIGSMVVGPEFGPIAGLCVALVDRRASLARRSAAALAVGFPVGVAATFLASLAFKWTGLGPDRLLTERHPLTDFVSQPDALAFVVAFLAGIAGVLSLTSTKSGALIGVLISVTTIPAAGNVGLAAGYGNLGEAGGALAQLVLNLSAIMLAALGTLYLQRRLYLARRRRHLDVGDRHAAGVAERRDGAPAAEAASGRRAGR